MVSIQDQIEELKKFDLLEDSDTNRDQHFKLAKKLFDGYNPSFVSPYDTNSFSCFRARKSSKGTLYDNLSELWYPPASDVKAGRLNYPNRPIFYCSSDLNSALIEVRPQLNDIVTLLEVGITVPEMNCIQFVRAKIRPEDYKRMEEHGRKEVFDFIASEIIKVVEEDQLQKYYTTQVFSSGIDNDVNSFDAIAYESVATGHLGYNFAILPKFIDTNHKFISATAFKVIEYRSPQDFTVKCIFKSDKLGVACRIPFRPVLVCPTHNISLKNFVRH